MTNTSEKPANAGLKQDGRFKRGRSGNPASKQRGTRNRTTLAVEALLDGEAEALTKKVIELGMAGDGVGPAALPRTPSTRGA